MGERSLYTLLTAVFASAVILPVSRSIGACDPADARGGAVQQLLRLHQNAEQPPLPSLVRCVIRQYHIISTICRDMQQPSEAY